MPSNIPCIIFETYQKVFEHFVDCVDQDETGGAAICRFDPIGTELEAEYAGYHVFVLYSKSSQKEINVPRALLPKKGRTQQEEDNIQALEYVNQPIETSVEPEVPPPEYKLSPEGPGKGDEIN